MLRTLAPQTRPAEPAPAVNDYKTLLVHAAVDDAARRRMSIAAALGHWFGATVMGLGADPFDPINDPSFGYLDADGLVEAEEKHMLALELSREAFVAAKADKGEWRGASLFPTDALLANARCADLVIASRPRHDALPSQTVNPADLTMGLGLPLLLLPEALEELSPRKVVLGWKEGQACRRAIGDALPFLRRAEQVVLSAVIEAEDEMDTAFALNDVAERLLRHGVNVEIEIRRKERVGVLGALLHGAAVHRADLLVLGAYGHSRAREWLFGGVTAEVLVDSPMAGLLSH